MKKHHQVLLRALILPSLLASTPLLANDQNTFDFKANGVALSMYSQKQDYKLTELSFDSPALAPFVNAKDKVVVESDITAVTLKLDRQVKPYLNVFGSVVKTRGDALVKFSNIPTPSGVPLEDMVLDADGMIYHLGATAIARRNDYFLSLTYIRSLSKLNTGTEDGKANTWAPSIGKKTKIGAFSLGVIYQEAEGGLNGYLNLPPLGQVKVDAQAENTHKLSYNAGYITAIAKDIFVRANVEFGDRQGINLEINKRF
jgi:hypothetical protein